MPLSSSMRAGAGSMAATEIRMVVAACAPGHREHENFLGTVHERGGLGQVG